MVFFIAYKRGKWRPDYPRHRASSKRLGMKARAFRFPLTLTHPISSLSNKDNNKKLKAPKVPCQLEEAKVLMAVYWLEFLKVHLHLEGTAQRRLSWKTEYKVPKGSNKSQKLSEAKAWWPMLTSPSIWGGENLPCPRSSGPRTSSDQDRIHHPGR